MSKKAKIDPEYNKMVNQRKPQRRVGFNCLKAFLSGGLLCAAAEAISRLLVRYAGLTDKNANDMTLIIVILATALVTGFGIYDTLAQKYGAGLAVPITGFANSITAASMDNKSEGYVLGLASNSFKLAGAVIVFGCVSAFIIGILVYIWGVIR